MSVLVSSLYSKQRHTSPGMALIPPKADSSLPISQEGLNPLHILVGHSLPYHAGPTIHLPDGIVCLWKIQESENCPLWLENHRIWTRTAWESEEVNKKQVVSFTLKFPYCFSSILVILPIFSVLGPHLFLLDSPTPFSAHYMNPWENLGIRGDW